MRTSKSASAKARLTEQVIAAGAFGGGGDVAELVLTTRLTNGLDGKGVVRSSIPEVSKRNVDVSVEVGEPPSVEFLGAIDGDDAKMGRTGGFNAAARKESSRGVSSGLNPRTVSRENGPWDCSPEKGAENQSPINAAGSTTKRPGLLKNLDR